MKYLPFLFLLLCFSCQNEKPAADRVLLNADIYTVNEKQKTAQAVAVKDGIIIAVGTDAEMQDYIDDETERIDLAGNFLMPGFIEGHGHFSGLGKSLQNLNFLQAKSWDEIVKKVEAAAAAAEPGAWIEGRGWHQEKWTEAPAENFNGYPYLYDLSAVSPDNPVVLFHASGHSLFANEAAVKAAGISADTPSPAGGEIVRDFDGNIVGVFEERAMTGIKETYQAYLETLSPAARLARWQESIDLAQKECLSKGITSFQDAGTLAYEVNRYTEMAENGDFDLRLWSMLRHPYDTLKTLNISDYRIIGAGDNFYTCRAIKSEVDGALGAFGAWLLRPYADKPGFEGQNTTPVKDVENIAKLALENDMQLCVHAIGDRANRVTLNIMEDKFAETLKSEELRWRIEHAQHLDTTDIPRFREMGVIASMQGIHCTSDAPFVEKRLGEERARYGAYPWRSLLDAGVLIANGTDAPVEDVSPLRSFYASVTRRRADTGLEFFTEQKMTREEAIYSYTLGNAYAAFEEDLKGSIEVGKVADFVLLSKNIVTCTDDEILETQVLRTMVGGEDKFSQTEK